MPEDGPCEYFTDDLEYDLYFDNDETFAVWAEEQLERKRRKKLKRKKAA
jgi:DNA/RNA endonuclease G (NUC1)